MPPFTTKNFGLVKAIHVGTTAPINTKMLWYNDNPGEKRLYYYNTNTTAWELLNATPQTIVVQVNAGETGVTINESVWGGRGNIVPPKVYMDIGDGNVRYVPGVEVLLIGISSPGAGDPTDVQVNFGGPAPTNNTYVVFD